MHAVKRDDFKRAKTCDLFPCTKEQAADSKRGKHAASAKRGKTRWDQCERGKIKTCAKHGKIRGLPTTRIRLIAACSLPSPNLQSSLHELASTFFVFILFYFFDIFNYSFSLNFYLLGILIWRSVQKLFKSTKK